jgi:hypothetical protein
VGAAIRTIRRMAIKGQRLYQSHPDPEARLQGWLMTQRAKRMARRLGYSLQAFSINL